MSKLIMLLLSMGMFSALSFGQSKFSIKGEVVDSTNEPLIGATVVLYPLEKGTTTNVDGDYVLYDVERGKYEIAISFIGYTSILDSITIVDDMVYNARLEPTALSLQEVVVIDNYVETKKKEESLTHEYVNVEYLKQNLGGSLMNSLERLAGVSTIDIGSGQSKPVIRGLGFNRIVVVENNIKHEAQQWGADHGLEIDQYAVDKVEIIKGPASLMYGSDAIGGVIDLKNKSVPKENTFGGVVDLSGKSNNNMLGTSVSLYGRKNWFYADARFTLLDYGDYKVPTDSVDIYSYRAPLYKNYLRNTAGKEQNLHLSFGVITKRFQSKFYLSSINGKSGFFANAHGLEPRSVDEELHDSSNRDIHYPFQKISHTKLTNSNVYRWEKLVLESNFGFQKNLREEWSEYVNHGYMPAVFPETLNFNPDLERLFDKYVYSENLQLHYYVSEDVKLDFGLSGEFQDNRIDGRGFIIPAYKQSNIGGFALGKYTISPLSKVQFGIRYDYGNIKSEEYHDWFPSPVVENGDTTMQYLTRSIIVDRHFSNISWSFGYNYYPGDWGFKLNVGKSFRMPIAKELAANGVNYHRFSYEIGNPDLSPEISWQIDLGAEYSSNRFAFGVSPFLNYFTNYIYLNPTSEHDRLYGNGNQIFYYTESDVLRYGTEFHTHYELHKFLQLGVLGEYVYSKQLSGEKQGYSLPFSPPPSAIFNVKYHKQEFRFIENSYLSVDFKFTAPQNNIVPPEETTEGYQIVNVSFGGEIGLMNRKIKINAQIQNLFNTKYFDHTSYYRLINVPGHGRNFILNISIPFSGTIKH